MQAVTNLWACRKLPAEFQSNNLDGNWNGKTLSGLDQQFVLTYDLDSFDLCVAKLDDGPTQNTEIRQMTIVRKLDNDGRHHIKSKLLCLMDAREKAGALKLVYEKCLLTLNAKF